MLAWRLYAEDHNDKFPYSYGSTPVAMRSTWGLGFMDNPAQAWDRTFLERSLLWPYAKGSYAIWRCPTDVSTIRASGGPNNGKVLPRIRSTSMNSWVGGNGDDPNNLSGYWGAQWRVFTRPSDMTTPVPAMTWVLMDERPESINDAYFVTDMLGWPDKPQITAIRDFPSIYHNKAGGLSFADGHSELKRWRHPDTLVAVPRGAPLNGKTSPKNPDIIWLQERSTRAK